MKKLVVILATASLLICTSFSGEFAEKSSREKNMPDITGTWKIEAARHNISSNEFTAWPESSPEIKFITEKSFCWVAYDANTKKVTSSAGGTYTLEGNTYTESINYGLNMDPYLGTKSTFTIKIEGDMMFISGSLSTGQRIEEIWHRVK